MSKLRKKLENANPGSSGMSRTYEDTIDESLFSNQIAESVNGEALVKVEKGVYQYGAFKLTKTAITLPDSPEESEAEALMRYLLSIESSVQFWIGDLALLWIPDKDDSLAIGRAYTDLATRFDLDTSTTLRDYCYVCRNVDPSVRTDTLTFSHHKVVAAMDEEDQKMWLQRASDNNWSVAKLKSETMPKKKKSSIYISYKKKQIKAIDKDLSKMTKQDRVDIATELMRIAQKYLDS